jgi:phosphoenolpyruvate---glycerone phosphotransferase subunit DhaK
MSITAQLINSPDAVVSEALEGFEHANRNLICWNREPSFVHRAEAPAGPKVALVSGGGSGHEPLHGGFVGYGMLDAAVPGAVFASPTAAQIQAATEHVDLGRGVLHIVKNYTGDVLNFSIAAELAAAGNVEIETVLVDDDLATDGTDPDGPGRRGTAAVIAVEKICGAAAERGADLHEVAWLGRRVVSDARSMAVALSGCTHPGQREPSFALKANEVELGVGIHGERGRERRALAPAAELATELVQPVTDALGLEAGERVIAIVNGLGATTSLELSIVYREVAQLLERRGVAIARSLLGAYITSLNMAGCSVTLVRVDDQLLGLWDAPVITPALRW